MFSHLAIDWGSKRCGLAFGERATGLVVPATYPCPTGQIFELLERELVQKNIYVAVLGKPTNFYQKATEVSTAVEAFSRQLHSQFPNLTVELVNENGSTQKARCFGIKDKATLNHLAAADILERYFYKLQQK